MLLKRTSTDRRRQKRQLLNTSVQIFTGSSHVHALGINLSDFGMCLFTIANLALGSEIELEFVPPRCNAPIRVFGTVRHRALYLYGIEYSSDLLPVLLRRQCTSTLHCASVDESAMKAQGNNRGRP